MTMACIGLTIAILAMPGTQPSIDSAHALMEPPPEHQPRPYVRPPAGSAVAAVLGSGMYRKLVALSRPRSALTLVAAVLLLTCLASPSTASALLLHIICFIGSLVEPFDSVLPNKFFLRPFIAQVSRVPERANARQSGSRVRLPPRSLSKVNSAVVWQVKSARKAYAIKHGLPLDLDAMEGFVDETVEAAAEAAAASAEAGNAETVGGALDDEVARESRDPDEPPPAIDA
jgi:hypothetical protein